MKVMRSSLELVIVFWVCIIPNVLSFSIRLFNHNLLNGKQSGKILPVTKGHHISRCISKEKEKVHNYDAVGFLWPMTNSIDVSTSNQSGLTDHDSPMICEYLDKIIDYGNNRMAKRAVNVLNKMSSFHLNPKVEHYTQAIWACEKTDQYELARSVFEQMEEAGVKPIVDTFTAMISLAEKTDHHNEAVYYFDKMRKSSLNGTTDVYNMLMLAYGRSGQSSEAYELLQEMSQKEITKDETTYAACLLACDVGADGPLSLQVLQEISLNGRNPTTESYNGALWACLRSGYWEDVLRLFKEMGDKNIRRDEKTFNAAIWAAEIGEDGYKAVQFLRLMKLEGNKRQTIAFDGCISALSKIGDYQQILEVLKWMEIDDVSKSAVTYRKAIDCLEQHGHDELIGEIYIRALRDGFFSPWIKKTRGLDLRGFSFALAKIAMKTVLLSMIDHKLSPFTMTIITGTIEPDPETGEPGITSSFNTAKFREFLASLNLASTGEQKEPHTGELAVKLVIDEGVEKLVIDRESLINWIERHQS